VGSGETFKYDPFGRRVQKSGPSGAVNYLYDAASLIEEIDNSGSILARYSDSNAVDEPLAILRSGTSSYYQADAVGSVTSLSSSGSALANTYTYNSFGKLTTSTGSVTNASRYTGREFDSETGLYFYRARYLDNNTGRFLSEDPIQFVTGAPYFYASNSPLNWVDPSGFAPGDWWDPRTPGNIWNQLNPFNPNGSFSHEATSIWDSLSGMATGNWAQVAQSYDDGPYGQIKCKRCAWRTAETMTLAGSGAAAGTAGGLILLDAAGISNIGQTQIGWRGGEITFTRPGCKTPDFRINPFGDDDWPPHYHRRPGIGRHRPWEGW
jgi:RHS repeat-associated protein